MSKNSRRSSDASGCELAPAPAIPAVHHDGPAEQVLEGVDPLPELQEQLGLLGDAVVRPAEELDLSDLPLRVLPLLNGRKTAHAGVRGVTTRKGLERTFENTRS